MLFAIYQFAIAVNCRPQRRTAVSGLANYRQNLAHAATANLVFG